MIRKELIKELQIREKELNDELEAIHKILSSNLNGNPVKESDQEKEIYKLAPHVSSKGNKSWENYVLYVINEFKEKAKSKEIRKVIKNANPEIPDKKIDQTISSQLSHLLKKGEIQAVKRDRRQGYEYYSK